MDLSMMDGFISALASGPNLTMPSSMLRWIWDPEHGKDAPTFANAGESASIITLIIRHWNDINDTLNRAPDEYEPLILERKADGRTIPIVDSWCSGYYKGIAVDRARWNPLLAQHPDGLQQSCYTALRTAGMNWNGARIASSSIKHSLTRWPAQCVISTATGWSDGDCRSRVAKCNCHWPSEPICRAPKVGRNVPCPCGSGKKYKRCHGAVEDAVVEDNRHPVHSPLSQRLSRDGTTVEIQIYDDGKAGGYWR